MYGTTVLTQKNTKTALEHTSVERFETLSARSFDVKNTGSGVQEGGISDAIFVRNRCSEVVAPMESFTSTAYS